MLAVLPKVNVSAYLDDATLSTRLGLLCAQQGWEVLIWQQQGDIHPIVEPGKPLADVIFIDSLAKLDSDLHVNTSTTVVLLTDKKPHLEHANLIHVHPHQSDRELVSAIVNSLNILRFHGQFFSVNYNEPITKLPHHSEVLETVSAHRGSAVGLVVVQVDHAEHLYTDLDPVSKTDLLGALSLHLCKTLPQTNQISIYDSTCFAVWCVDSSEKAVHEIAMLLCAQGNEPIHFHSGILHITFSLGMAHCATMIEPQDLWQAAWLAKEQARQQGGNRVAHASANHAAISEGLADRIPQALSKNEFSLVLQPQYDITGTKLRGVEALLRWQGMEVGNLAPEHFIPIAERSGQMARVGDWVLERACCESATWLEHRISPIVLGVNTSPQQFHNEAIKHQIFRLVKDRWLDPTILELELTHSNLLQVVDQHRQTLYSLRDLGVHIAIDNLGLEVVDTEKLLRCPADTLKIDRHLIANIDQDDQAKKLVEQICQLGNRFSLKVVAVGVETEVQRHCLENLGCPFVQGYLFAQPVALETFQQYLAQGKQATSVS